MPSYLGPLVQAYEYDLINFEVTNAVCQNMANRKLMGGMEMGEMYEECMGQATHCKWVVILTAPSAATILPRDSAAELTPLFLPI